MVNQMVDITRKGGHSQGSDVMKIFGHFGPWWAAWWLVVYSSGPTLAQSTEPPKSFASPVTGALTRDSYPIDLLTALRLADADNPTIAFARAKVDEARARYRQAQLIWLPTLSFGPTLFYHQGIDQNRRGDTFIVSRGYFALLAGPQLRLDLSEALYRPLAARRLATAAQSRSQTVRNTVELQVVFAYLDLVEAHALLAINADILTRTEQIVEAARAGAKAGTGKTAADLNRAETELALRQQERVVLRGRAAAAATRLAALLNLDPTIQLVPFETGVVPLTLVPPNYDLQQLLAIGLVNHPEVVAVREELAAARAVLSQARADPLLPKVQVDLLAGGLTGRRNSSPEFTSPFQGQYNLGAAFVWEFEAFGLGNLAAVRAQQANVAAAIARLREIQNRVAAEIVEAAQLSLARYEALRTAQEAVRQSQEMYRKFRDVSFGVPGPKGQLQFDALEVLTAVQALNQSRVQFLQQVIEYNRQQFRLFTALGQPAVLSLNQAQSQMLELPVVPPAVSNKP
jgi:outer membrane protein TolC